jgi:hypothetical protein
LPKGDIITLLPHYLDTMCSERIKEAGGLR